MTLDQVTTAQELIALIGSTQVFHHTKNKNADGTPQRWRLNGQIKTWKKDPTRIRIPLKYGLYGYGAIESVADFKEYLTIPS